MPPITANADEYKSKVGLDSLYIAAVTADSASGYTADTPEYLAPAASASQEPTSSLETQYADDQPYDVMSAEGPTKITLDVTGMPNEMLAKILGKKFDSTTGRLYDYGGTPPYIALSFRSMKSNGKYRYYQYLKGKFSPPKEETATRGEKPEPKTLQLEFQAIFTTYKFDIGSGVLKATKRIVGDEDTTNFSATNFFSQVQTPTATSPVSLALSSSDPAAGASGVAVTKVLTMTFNNALAAGEETDLVLVNSATGAQVAGTNTIDAARKVVTVGHTANLAAATLHRIVYTVKDIYGQTLQGVVSFTTA